jgi:hypothetical protein
MHCLRTVKSSSFSCPPSPKAGRCFVVSLFGEWKKPEVSDPGFDDNGDRADDDNAYNYNVD